MSADRVTTRRAVPDEPLGYAISEPAYGIVFPAVIIIVEIGDQRFVAHISEKQVAVALGARIRLPVPVAKNRNIGLSVTVEVRRNGPIARQSPWYKGDPGGGLVQIPVAVAGAINSDVGPAVTVEIELRFGGCRIRARSLIRTAGGFLSVARWRPSLHFP